MPYALSDGVRLYYEETGEGYPVLFIHEFAGDHRSWEPQLRYFSRRYRCITYGARGYPPSDVPADGAAYGQDIARKDAIAVLDHLDIPQAHVVGLSMGGFAAIHVGLYEPARASALVVAGCGYGAPADARERFKAETDAMAARFDDEGAAAVGADYALGPTRVQFETKDPRGWDEFRRQMMQHSATGSANTMRGVQGRRPSLYDLEEGLARLTVPTLLITGDEDEPCLDANLYLKRTIPTAGLLVIPKSGHTINLEEPEAFNRACADFFVQVEQGRWLPRDPRSTTGASITRVDADKTA
jgi:pimeloyl-ACP methyl ester carboxylesterase